jgi:TrbL/VirB6 plasmid conjugal transfer protein
MAEPRPPASRHRPGSVLGLAGAILVIVLGGLFLARPASAATIAPAQPVAHSQPAVHSAPAVPAAPDASMATGVCAVPGIGDIGGLLGLCTGGSAGVVGDLNNICTPSVPQPEQANSTVNEMIATPGGQTGGKTLYDNYGIAGQYWAATGLQCSDMTSLIGNNVAGMVFDLAKSLDRATITVYQTAAGNGILTWLQNAVNTLITALGNAIYYPFLAPVVILGAVWLAWQGLIRKRATRTIEGTIWMVLACAAAVWLIGRPADFTGIGTTVSNGVTQVLNTAFAKLPAPAASNCLPVTTTDPQSVTASYAFTSGNGLVDENANELWSVLVCKPWLDGELGTTQWAPPNSVGATTNVVNQFGRQLLWSQAIAANEKPTQALITAKQDTYTGIAQKLQANYPAVYPLFQGNQWTTRLEIGFEAMFAALAAGLLVLLISLTLIILKLSFLLLLVAGPFFLIVGVHPGFGRVIAIRWFEMLVGVLMKSIAIALVLSVLLYCYSLIMGTTDQTLPWGLKIMMIALVTVAVFIYRKPFTHLFSSVGYGVIGSTERAEYSWREASFGFRRASANAAGAVVPVAGASRAARWARRSPAAAAVAGGAAGAAAVAAAGGGDDATGTGSGPGTGSVRVPNGAPAADGHAAPRLRSDGAPPASEESADATAGGGGGTGGNGAGGNGANGRPRQWPEAGGGASRAAPPLPLPARDGSTPAGSPPAWARGSAARSGTASGRSAAPPRAPRPSSNGNGNGNGTSGTPVRATAQPPVRRNASGGVASGSRPAGGNGWFSGGGTGRSDESGAVPAATERPSPMPFWLRPRRRDK